MPNFPWNRVRDDELPEELKGKTPAEIAQALKDAAALKTQVDALAADKTRLEGEVATVNNSFTETKNRLQALEEAARRPATPPATPPGTPAAPPSIWDDEEAAMGQRINNRVAPIESAVVNTGLLTAKMYAEQQLQRAQFSDPKFKDAIKIFHKYEGEIDRIVGQEPPARQILPQTWVNAFIYVRGLHSTEIVDAATKGDNTFFAEVGGSTPPPPPTPQEDKLTDKELQIAQRMRLTPAQYLEQKKKMHFVNV